MNKATVALTVAVSLLGCGSDDEGRSAARIAEVERITTTGSTTTIERLELVYDDRSFGVVQLRRVPEQQLLRQLHDVQLLQLRPVRGKL